MDQEQHVINQGSLAVKGDIIARTDSGDLSESCDADQVIRMATCGGAKAIGMEKLTGTLEAGEKADMILFDPRHLKSFPNHDAEATVVYSSSEENIDTTIVNGRIVFQKGCFVGGLSEAELVQEIAVEVEKMKHSAQAI